MFRDPSCLDKFATVMVGCAVMGATVSGLPVPAGAGEAAAAAGGLMFWRKLKGRSDADKVLACFQADLHANWEAWGETSSHADPNARASAAASFEQVIPHCTPTGAEIAGRNLDPAGIAALMLAKAETAMPGAYGPENPDTALARKFLERLTQNAYRHLLGNSAFVDQIVPALWRELLETVHGLKDQGAETQRLIRDLSEKLTLSQAERETLADAATRAQEQLKSTQTLIQGFLQSILDRNVPADQLVATLFELAAEWRQAGQRIDALTASRNLTPEIASLRDRARKAYRGERTDEVWDLLTQIETLEQTSLDRLLVHQKEIDEEVALRREGLIDTKEGKLSVALAGFRILDAARLVVEIAETRTPDPAARFAAIRAAQDEWYVRGRDKGLNLDVEVSIEVARISHTRAATPGERGAALNDLGISLATLGERETGTDHLDQAAAAYREALTVYTRDRVPLDWAMTQNNLGNALLTLSERETGTDHLDQAAAAYREALTVYTRDRVPLDWAATQNNLGNALATLGQRETGTVHLDQAAAAYREALTVYTRDRVPLQWAATQNNLGNALATLGRRETGTVHLDQAVAAYREALLERTRDRVPLDWAATQNNLGNALTTLGQRETGTVHLDQAAAAYREALTVYTRDRVPLDWAITQFNLASVHIAYFQKTAGPTHLGTAQSHADAALEVFRAAGATHYIGMAERQLGNIARLRSGG